VFEVALSCLAFLWFENPEQALREMLRVAKRVYVVEEEGVPARKRIEIPKALEKFFETIGSLEKEVYIEELDAYRSSSTRGKVCEADIDGSHKFICWELRKP
jgi:ubiquinone/menaquinone biosynthesis C-methylase UbiE